VALAADATAGVVAVTLAAATCNASAADAMSSYYASAIPQPHVGTGTRSFATDTRGTIFYTTIATAPANPIPAGALVVQ
jgi:hypothetical protein